jgi:hypothetical protein
VNDELEEQAGLLLKLRNNLKVYHSMKAEYEQLVLDVQRLEGEKQEPTSLFEKSNADPRFGCSKSIKKKLDMVKQNLSCSRKEVCRYREMARKREQEAHQKREALERRISEFTGIRADLVKRQKEAATKHRRFAEAKEREIATLREAHP